MLNSLSLRMPQERDCDEMTICLAVATLTSAVPELVSNGVGVKLVSGAIPRPPPPSMRKVVAPPL